MDDDIATELTTLRLHSQADVQRMWDLLMRPLGFGSHTLWITLVDDRAAPIPNLVQIADSDAVPTEQQVAQLFEFLREICAHQADITSFAFLLSHPGRGGLTDFDRQYAARLMDGARASGVRCHPVHVANDDVLVPVSADDLAA